MSTAADKAKAVEPKCKSMTEAKVASFASASAVDSVEPNYAFVPSTASNHEARLQGALLHLKPVANFSREAMARGLECHEARVVLGKAPPFADDPYVLPDRWLSIDVDSEGDSFAVKVRAETFRDAQSVLSRAKLFVSDRPPEVVTAVVTQVVTQVVTAAAAPPPSAAPAERSPALTASLPSSDPAPSAGAAAPEPDATAK